MTINFSIFRQKLDGSQDDVQILTPGKKDVKNGEMKEEKKEKVPELTSPEALLNKLEEYIKDVSPSFQFNLSISFRGKA